MAAPASASKFLELSEGPMGREIQLLVAAISDTFEKASRVERELSDTQMNLALSNNKHDLGLYADEADTEDRLKHHLERLYRDVGMLAEKLQVATVITDIEKLKSTYDEKHSLRMEIDSVEGQLICPSLAKIRHIYSSLETIATGYAVTGIDVLRTMLENTATILSLRGVIPTNEVQIQKAVFEFLKVAFTDTVRDIPVGQLFKTYKPDFGVRSLMAAIEYKFVDSEDEFRTAIDGIYTDMKGYSGHDEWRTFFAVFYTTGYFTNSKTIQAEFERVGAEPKWIPIIVQGPGARSSRSRTK